MSMVQEVEIQEVSEIKLRKLVRQAGGFNSDSLGDACGGGCGRGANCNVRSEEMNAVLCGAD